MANTKKLSREQRRATKRRQRRELKSLYQSLTKKQRAALRKEKQGIKKFLAAQQAGE